MNTARQGGQLIRLLWVVGALFISSTFADETAGKESEQKQLEAVIHRAKDEAAAGRKLASVQSFIAALHIAERLYGADHVNVAIILENLAVAQQNAANLAEAEAAFRRSVSIMEQRLGSTSTEFLTVSASLGRLLALAGKTEEAATVLSKVFTQLRATRGDFDPALERIAGDLAWLYLDTAAYGRAAELQEFLLKLLSQRAGSRSETYVTALERYALMQVGRYRYGAAWQAISAAQEIAEAIPTLGEETRISLLTTSSRILSATGQVRQALVQQRSLVATLQMSADSVVAANAVYELALIEETAGNITETARLLNGAAARYARSLGEKHPMAARVQVAKANLEARLGRVEHAVALAKAALALAERSYGVDSPRAAMFKIGVASFEANEGHYDAAMRDLSAAKQSLGQRPELYRLQLTSAQIAEGRVLLQAGRHEEAEGAFAKAEREGRSSGHLTVQALTGILSGRAEALIKLDRYRQATEVAQEAVAQFRDMGAEGLGAIGKGLYMLVTALVGLGKHDEAMRYSQQLVELFERRREVLMSDPSETAEREVRLHRDAVLQHVALHEDRWPFHGEPRAVAETVFRMLQFATDTTVARTVSQASARLAASESDLGGALRAMQDDMHRYRAVEKQLENADLRDGSSTDAKQRMHDELNNIASAIRRRSEDIQRRYPEFAALMQPSPLTIGAAQSMLAEDEALLIAVVADTETYIALVRKSAVHLNRTGLSNKRLGEIVLRLRAALVPDSRTNVRNLPLFPVEDAHDLYRHILGSFEAQLQGIRHLIAVVDGPLQSIPLSVLVKRKPERPIERTEDYERVAWLGADVAVSVLPSVSSLKALRKTARPSRAPRPFLGIGDPKFDGDAGSGRQAPSRRSLITASGVNLDAIRHLAALPDSAIELQAIAQHLGAGPDDILLRDKATLSAVRAKRLRDYRVIAFATHGLVAGEFQGLAEPALVLSPPAQLSKEDDGLLTASRVASLDLDADWVVLSACNTAATDEKLGATGMSGLAQAFFYAGARTLLVTHWAVASEVATRLTTSIFSAMHDDASLSRAEAMRLAISKLIRTPEKGFLAHPMFWAPFALMGDGGRKSG